MLRNLLEQRFSLRVRREPRSMEVYALVQARPDGQLGANLKPVVMDCSKPDSNGRTPCTFEPLSGRGRFAARGLAWSEAGMAAMLSLQLDRLVIDKTGLSGQYDIVLDWNPRPGGENPAGSAAPIDTRPNAFVALQEQLGLKLETQRHLVDVLVVEQVKAPDPN